MRRGVLMSGMGVMGWNNIQMFIGMIGLSYNIIIWTYDEIRYTTIKRDIITWDILLVYVLSLQYIMRWCVVEWERH